MPPPYNLVTLVTDGGVPVQLVDQVGAPFPTTGTGALVFADAPTLYNAILSGTITVENVDVTGNATVGGTLDVGSLATLHSASITNDLAVGGTITSGLWHGTTIGVDYGGTGLTGYAVGDLIYASGATTLAKLPVGTNGQFLSLVGGLPAWVASPAGIVSFSAGTTGLTPSSPVTGAVVLGGVLNAASGGTGISSYAVGDLIYASGATTLAKLPVGTNGQVLTLVAGVPAWASSVNSFSGGTTGLTPSSPTTGAVVLGGTLGVANGGTGADLSATGGTSQVLRQSTVGGAVTVSQLAASDLSNGTSGSGAVVLASGAAIAGATITTSAINGALNTITNIANASLVNSSITINGSTVALGGSATITAAASAITVGTTAVSGGTTGRVLYNNAGTLGEMTTSGTGTQLALTDGPTFTGFTSTANLQTIVADGTYGFYVKNATNWLRFSGYVSGASFIEAVNNLQSAWTTLTIGGSVVNLNSNGANIIAVGASSVTFNVAATSVSGLTLYNATSIPAGGTAGVGLKFSSTANFGVFYGSGAPTLSAAQGSLYVRSDGAPYYNNNGSTGWTQIGAGITAANDSSTASNLYPLFAAAATGTLTSVYTDNGALNFKPSTGEFTAKVPVAGNGMFVNSQTVSANYTIAAGQSAVSAGPVSVASGVTVTISAGSRWVVV